MTIQVNIAAASSISTTTELEVVTGKVVNDHVEASKGMCFYHTSLGTTRLQSIGAELHSTRAGMQQLEPVWKECCYGKRPS